MYGLLCFKINRVRWCEHRVHPLLYREEGDVRVCCSASSRCAKSSPGDFLPPVPRCGNSVSGVVPPVLGEHAHTHTRTRTRQKIFGDRLFVARRREARRRAARRAYGDTRRVARCAVSERTGLGDRTPATALRRNSVRNFRRATLSSRHCPAPAWRERQFSGGQARNIFALRLVEGCRRMVGPPFGVDHTSEIGR
jgi:hypothetical protein